MPLINIVIALIVIGVLLWLINTYVPMDPKIRSILNGVVVIVVIIWLLQAFGLIGSLNTARISRDSSIDLCRSDCSFPKHCFFSENHWQERALLNPRKDTLHA